MTLKKQAHQFFYSSIRHKIAIQQDVLSDLNYSAANETKSTAGDKHETALAMLQIEQAHVGKKVTELKLQLLEISQIDETKINKTAALGSLIKTDTGYFYLSAALGKANIENENIFALSIRSPLGILFMGKKVGSQINFNKITYTILALL